MPVLQSEYIVLEEIGESLNPKDTIIPTPTITIHKADDSPPQVKEETETCLLCLEALTDPKPLQCGHIFCLHCLTDYIDDYPEESTPKKSDFTAGTVMIQQMRCPTCLQITRTCTDLPPVGVMNNQARHDSGSSKETTASPMLQNCDVCSYSSRLMDAEVHCSKCSLYLCYECKEVHGSHDLFKFHHVVHISNIMSMSIYCDEHNNHQSMYFCDVCQHACCVICLLQAHNGHGCCTLIDALSYRREKLKSQLNLVGPQLDKLELRLKTLNHIANRKAGTNSMSFFNSVSETTNDVNQNMDNPLNIYGKNEVDVFEESSHLLPQFTVKDENIPFRNLQRKRNSVDHGMDLIKNLSFSSVKGRRRTSFLDNFRIKKTSDGSHIPVDLHLNTSLQINNQHDADAHSPSRSPSPRFRHKSSRRSSASSRSSISSRKSPVSPPWHQSTRMEKLSPVLQRRNLVPDQPNFYSLAPSQNHGSTALLPVEQYMPVDLALVGKYQHQIQLIRKLYNHAAMTVSAKGFLETFTDLDQRLVSATNIEVKQLKRKVHDMMDEHETVLQALAMTPSSSFTLIDMIGATSRRKNSPSSAVDAALHKQLSMLLKPKLMWDVQKHKSDPGDLWNRCGIAFLPSGNTVVTEYDMNNIKNNRLHIYDSTGETVSIICEEQMCPLGVAVTPEGHIAVTDCKSKRVKIVTESGQSVCEWGKGHFGWPHGIAINSKGHFIVSDTFNDLISFHQPDGKLIRQIGCSGSVTNCFRNPFHVAVDRNDNVIVSDYGNNCIKVFNKNGQFLFSNKGISVTSLEGFDANSNERHLNGPRGVAVDPKGNILVADDASRVVMFDSQGKYIRNVLTEEEHVKFVEGVAVNKDGVLALTECNPSHMFAVKVFSLYESSRG